MNIDIERMNRRDLLKWGGVAAVATVAGAIIDRVTPGFLARTVEASGLPTELPPHITYYSRSEQKYLEGSARVIKPLAKGDIWLAQAQKLSLMGNDYNCNPEANPGSAIVFAVGAATDLDFDFRTVQGVYAWTGLESSPRFGGDFIQDILTAGRVQVSRAQIPGNCIPSGCSEVKLVTALGYRDTGGVVRFDAISDERFTK